MQSSDFSTSRRKRALPIIIGVVVIAATVIVYMLFFRKQESAIPQANEPQPLPVAQVRSNVLFREDQVPGEIHAYQDVLIYPKVPGFIEWIGVDRGSIVKKGQLMVKMYAPEYLSRQDEATAKVAAAKAQLAAGESKLESARASLQEEEAKLVADKSSYERLKAASLVPGVVATNDVIVLAQTVESDQQSINSWRSNVKAAAHEVTALKDSLKAANKSLSDYSDFASYLEIRAPFNGYITDRDMHVGSFVGPLGNGAYPAICRIQQLDLLRIVAPIPERDTAGVLPGAKVDFSVSTFPAQRFSGTVARLGNYLQQATRTMPVELNYNNPDNRIRPGMFCKVYWPTRRPEPTLFVPITAVVATALDTFVCKVKDNAIEWAKVTKGQIMGNMVEVFGDVHEGDLVAKIGSEELQVGTAVKPVLVSKEEQEATPPKREPYHLNAQ